MAGAGITTVPSAIGGVDFYSSIFGMDPSNAIRLTNWWPDVYGCAHRRGYVEWQSGLPASVDSLYAYHGTAGKSMLFAFSGSAMYDVTTQEAVPAAKVTGLSTALWEAAMFATSGGTQKVFVSGADHPIWVHMSDPVTMVYDRLVPGNGTTAGTISGVDPTTFVDVEIHQKRLWFVQKNSTYGWYLPTDQAWGVASLFDFGPLFRRGGYLQGLATWTVDDGTGSDDLLVAFGSEGDIAVYKGIDPTGGTDPINNPTWTLQGVYYAGALASGRRFHTKVSGDLRFITTQGLVSMNDMLTSTRVISPEANIESRPIQQFLAEQISQYGDLPGWDLKFVPSINMLIINVPSVTQDGALQLVENIVNSKWSTFLGMDANCLVADYTDVFHFGAGSAVYQGWTGYTDNVTPANPAGVPITALVQQSYNYFGTPANNKQVGLYRPNFLVTRDVLWKSYISYDFTISVPTVAGNPTSPPDENWDTAIWDRALWQGGLKAQKQWASAAGMGFAGSLSMATRSDGEVIWVNTDFTVSSGGIL